MTRLVSSHAGFDTIIDARSPSEFAHSHIPQAHNFPVLDDAQFKQIGTLYHEDSLRAKFLGASMASVSYTHLTLPTILRRCRSRWSPYH